MIDWVTAILPCKHDPSRLIDGLIYSYDALGNEQWMVEKKLSIEGSFSSKVQIKSHDNFSIYGFQAIQQSFYKVIIFSVLMIYVI